MMELRSLQYFVAMYEERSISRAARRLNIVQPAISHQLAKLEDEIGDSLFQRTPRGLVPTQAGQEAYRLFLPILRSVEDARQALSAPRDTVKGHVAIGVVASVAHNALPGTLAAFSAKFPEVTLRATGGYTRELLQMLRAGDLDLVVVNGPVDQEEFQQIDLITETLAVIQAADADSKREIGFVELDQHRLVVPSRRHGLRSVLEDAVARQALRLSPRYEFDEIGTIENFVVNTDFFTILPPIAVTNALRAGLLQALPLSPRISRQLVGIHHVARPLSRAATVLLEELRDRLVAVQRELNL